LLIVSILFYIFLYNFLFYIFFYFFSGHPSIFYQLLQKKGIQFPTLKRYIEKREEVFAEIIKDHYQDFEDEKQFNTRRSYIKQEIISCLNGGSYESAFKNGWWSNFYFETKEKLSQFFDCYVSEFPYFTFLKVHKNDKTRNKLGSAIAYYLQSKENEILYHIIQKLISLNFEISALSFDGIMVNKNDLMDAEVLNSIENYVFENTNIRIKLIVKEQEDGFKIDEEYVEEINIEDPHIMDAPIDYENENEIVRLLGSKQTGQSKLVHHHFKEKVYMFQLLLFFVKYLFSFLSLLDFIS